MGTDCSSQFEELRRIWGHGSSITIFGGQIKVLSEWFTCTEPVLSIPGARFCAFLGLAQGTDQRTLVKLKLGSEIFFFVF